MNLPTLHLFLTTAPGEEAAETIARHLVESRLAACVSIVPGLRSLYTWKGEVQDEEEVLLLVKSCAPVEAVRDGIKAVHPYAVPEVLAFPASFADEAYARWAAGLTAAK